MTELVFPKIEGVKLEPLNHASHTPVGGKIGLHYLAVDEARIGTGLPMITALSVMQTGVLHGGVVTALIDETAGGAAVSAAGGEMAVATVDLRIDYTCAQPSRACRFIVWRIAIARHAALLSVPRRFRHPNDR